MRRLSAYMLDRCNPVQMSLMTVCFGGAIALLVPAVFAESTSPTWLVLPAFLLFLIRLRVLDDIKDFWHDSIHHSERPTARGEVGKTELSVVAAVVLIAELCIAWVVSSEAFVVFVLAFVYSAMLFLEAILIDRMRHQFTFYIFLHELMLVPALAYFFLVAGAPLAALWSSLAIITLGFFLLALFQIELIRKVHVPTTESTGEDTYSAQYGIPVATAVSVANAGLVIGLWSYILFGHLSVSDEFSLFIGLLPMLVWFGFVSTGVRLLADPSVITEKRFFITGCALVVVLLVAVMGVVWQ